MVLSNKKLKQKLREQLSKTLVSSQSKTSTVTPPSSNLKSLTQLLDAAAHKPRLTKREKRRKNPPLESGEAAEDPTPEDGGASKKRKMDEGQEGSDLKLEEETTTTKKKKSKKKKKKSKKKTPKKVEDVKKEVEEKEEPVQGSELLSEIDIGDQFVVPKEEINDGQGNMQVSKKVYVGGIPYYSSEDDIRSFFDHCGTITEVDCMKFPETGKFRGIAILEFKTEEAAKRAMALDGGDMGGFFLKVQPYNKTTTRVEKTPAFSPPVIQGYNRIYAGNLSWDITEDDLRYFFSECSVSSIRFGEDKETKEFKGYAHVDFSDSTSLEKALEMDQMVVCGRPVRITCAVALRNGKPDQSTSKDTTDNRHTFKVTVNNNSTADNKAGMNLTTTMGTAVNNVRVSLTTTDGADNKADVSFTNTTVGDAENKPGVSAGKSKRRNCYLCGERGHISSDCPEQVNKETEQVNKETNPSIVYQPTIEAENIVGVSSTTTASAAENIVAASEDAADNKPGVSAGKLRRRNCYLCGERGHISSACPNPSKG